ncbi:MAG TPA: SDR family oxidoreductase [Chloroflexota bacterium]|nr:SDR family oxidoreductase [Chloroflexota bacterium]
MQLKPIEDQVVAVVGAASGIGRETAIRFARRGAVVHVFDIDAHGLDTLAAYLKSDGHAIRTAVGDVADSEALRSFAGSVVDACGRLDTWVHCTGIGLYATFRDTTMREFRRVIEVNLLGQVHGADAALPHLLSNGGALIHVSSIEAIVAFPYHSAYAASKHGVHGFLQTLRVELRHDGVPVSVTEIMPASINTPFFEKAMTKIGVKPKGVPPLYEPGDVAEAILYAAEHPTAQIIVGGAGKMALRTQRFTPGLMEAFSRRFGYALQRTNQPKSADAPNDLFGAVGQYDTVRGTEGGLTFRHSLSTWLDTHPRVKRSAEIAALGGIGALVARRMRPRITAGKG